MRCALALLKAFDDMTRHAVNKQDEFTVDKAFNKYTNYDSTYISGSSETYVGTMALLTSIHARVMTRKFAISFLQIVVNTEFTRLPR